jgi:hypothetical protein
MSWCCRDCKCQHSTKHETGLDTTASIDIAYITDLDIHGFRSVGLYYCTEYHYYSICRGRRFPRAHVEANNAPSMQQNLLQ